MSFLKVDELEVMVGSGRKLNCGFEGCRNPARFALLGDYWGYNHSKKSDTLVLVQDETFLSLKNNREIEKWIMSMGYSDVVGISCGNPLHLIRLAFYKRGEKDRIYGATSIVEMIDPSGKIVKGWERDFETMRGIINKGGRFPKAYGIE